MTQGNEGARKLAVGVGAGAAVFVLATAIFTGNPGLYILAGLSAASTMGLLATRPKV